MQSRGKWPFASSRSAVVRRRVGAGFPGRAFGARHPLPAVASIARPPVAAKPQSAIPTRPGRVATAAPRRGRDHDEKRYRRRPGLLDFIPWERGLETKGGSPMRYRRDAGKSGSTIWRLALAALVIFLIERDYSPSLAPAQSSAGLLLVLAFDVSASVNDAEFELQRAGTAAALSDPAVRAAVRDTPGGIAIAVVQWSSVRQQAEAIGWSRLIDDAALEAYARAVAEMPRRLSGGGTMIHGGLDFAAAMFADAPVAGRRRVIDLSANGIADDQEKMRRSRHRILEKGILINGLAIEEDDKRLTRYFRETVIGGPGAFVVTADDFDDFEKAMRIKLLREIRPPPIAAAPRTREGRGG